MLLKNLIKMYGYTPYKDMQIEFCGLREGEKLYEELLMDEENLKSTYNKKIFISNQVEIPVAEFKKELKTLFDVANNNSSNETVDLLHKMVPTFKTPSEANKEVATVK